MNEPSFIVLNTRHIPAARIFTLFHEYAHLLLREAEVFPEEENELEHWCDNFASELLLPEKLLTKELMTEEKDFFLPILLGSPIDLQSLLGVCRKLSDKFKVSREAILKKLQRLVPDKIDKKIYQAACQVWNREEKRQYFPLGPIERTLLRRGNSFVRLIMEAHKEKLITTADFLELLSLKLEHLSKPSFYKLLGTSK
jgi:Zn-dependent peptidase ImmA (M78 family)